MIGWWAEGANGDQQRTGSGGLDCGCSACSGGAAGAGRSGATRRNNSGTRGSPACSGFRCEIGVNVSAGVVVPDSFAEKRYTSPGLARGVRRMRSYVIWLATGPHLCSSRVAQRLTFSCPSLYSLPRILALLHLRLSVAPPRPVPRGQLLFLATVPEGKSLRSASLCWSPQSYCPHPSSCPLHHHSQGQVETIISFALRERNGRSLAARKRCRERNTGTTYSNVCHPPVLPLLLSPLTL